MGDGILDDLELKLLYSDYGQMMVDELLQELQYNLDENGANRGGLTTRRGLVASTGAISDVGWATAPVAQATPVGTTGSVQTRADLEDGVAAGTARGNETQNGLIQELIMLATRIANKEWTVNVTPTSDWGRHNQQSREAYDRVNG